MLRLACLICSGWAALLCVPAHAELEANRLWLTTGFYSAHFDTDKGLRNANPGLGLEYRIDEDWSATAGRFINSDNAHSSYVGAC